VFCSSRALLRGGYNYDSTEIRSPFDTHSTAIRPRYDHSTTYVMTRRPIPVVGCYTAPK